MKVIAEMTDAEIVAAVRSGSHALVPIDKRGGAVVGHVTLDDWEGVEGRAALLMPLSQAHAKFVAAQVIR